MTYSSTHFKKVLLSKWNEEELEKEVKKYEEEKIYLENLRKEMKVITNILTPVVEEPIKKKKKKKNLIIIKKVEEPKVEQPSPMELVFGNSDIREQIMGHKQKLLDDDWEKFKHIDWSEIMTIDKFRDIITEFAWDCEYMDRKERLNLKMDWSGLYSFINDMRCGGFDFFYHYMIDMDYYWEKEAYQRKLNGEPLIDTTYERQHPPKQQQKKDSMDEDTKLVCKLLRKTYKNKKQWANKLTQIGIDKGFLKDGRCWKKLNTLEYSVYTYLHYMEENKKMGEYLQCVGQLLEDEGIETEEYD